jgi:class 3 adenylate cyclase
MERALRVYGDSLRRIAEAESEWWRSEFQDLMIERGATYGDVARRAGEVSPELSRLSDAAVLNIFHAQQQQAWTANIATGVARALAAAGVRPHRERPPAMCFLDLTGFTSLTQAQGDAAAAALVERLNTLVLRVSVEHGGRPVKWLGDGVMLHYPEPPGGVHAALVMVEAIPGLGLPPAHVGLHVGPVVRQEGDYYGQTVNVAARIGDFARPGEVLVSAAVVEAVAGSDLAFSAIGPVELKGVSGPVELYVASRT